MYLIPRRQHCSTSQGDEKPCDRMAGPVLDSTEECWLSWEKERSPPSVGDGHRVGKGVTPKPSGLLYGFAEDSCFFTGLSPGRDIWSIP